MSERIMVSACLLGATCRYDGKDSKTSLPIGPQDTVIPICPEVAAGFGIPRPEIQWTQSGRVRVVDSGKDVTAPLRDACIELGDRARLLRVDRAVLKRRSPSCGTRKIWCDGELVDGEGMLAPYLRKAGVHVEGAPR